MLHLLHSEADTLSIKLHDVQYMTRRIMLWLAKSINSHKVHYMHAYKSFIRHPLKGSKRNRCLILTLILRYNFLFVLVDSIWWFNPQNASAVYFGINPSHHEIHIGHTLSLLKSWKHCNFGVCATCSKII